METPVEIVFHNMHPSEAVEADIRKRVAKLEKFYGRLTSCRVSIEARSKQHRTGNIFEVHVEMQAPGGHLVVSKEPHHVENRRRVGSIRTSIQNSFKAAEAQLRSFHDRQHGDVKLRPSPDVELL